MYRSFIFHQLPTDEDEAAGNNEIIKNVSTFVVTIFVGGWLFSLSQNWHFVDAVYFAFVTSTTIGYGDQVNPPFCITYLDIFFFF